MEECETAVVFLVTLCEILEAYEVCNRPLLLYFRSLYVLFLVSDV